MEENNENKAVEAEVIKENTSSTKQTNKAVEFIKSKKKIIGILILAIIVIIVAIDLIFVSPKEVVKKFMGAFGKGDLEKAMDQMDYAGAYVLADLDEEDYDDFWSEYKDFRDSDDYDDMMDEVEESMKDNEYIDEFKDQMEEYDISVKVDKISKVKKEASHLYRVTAKIEIAYEDYEMSGNMYFYVMKNGTKSYVVGMDSEDSSIGSMFSGF